MKILLAVLLFGFFLSGMKWPKLASLNWALVVLAAIYTVGVIVFTSLITLDSPHMNQDAIEASKPYMTWLAVVFAWLPCVVLWLGRVVGSGPDELSSGA